MAITIGVLPTMTTCVWKDCMVMSVYEFSALKMQFEMVFAEIFASRSIIYDKIGRKIGRDTRDPRRKTES